jgi:NitT/TauT family transport system permease protein
MAEQVVARRNTGQGVGMLLFVLVGGLLIGVALQVIVGQALGYTGAALAQSNVIVAIVWPVWAIVAVEAIYAKMPPYQRIWPLGTARAIVGFLGVIFVWELFTRYFFTNALVLVPLSKIWDAFLKLLTPNVKPLPATAPPWEQLFNEACLSRQLCLHSWTSFQEFIVGYAAAAIIGILIGLLLATNLRVRDYAGPWVSFLYAVPLVAIAPLFIVAFGIGLQSKMIVIFLVAVFIIVVNTEVGVLSTDPHLIEAARSFGASRLQIFRKVLLPAALPFIIAGLRLGMARGLVGVVVAELFGAKAGLGFLILASAQVFDTASLFVGVLVLAIGGYLGVELLKYVEHKMAPWRHFEFKD